MFGGYHPLLPKKSAVETCLGPCFSGCLVGTENAIKVIDLGLACLGPCFSGCLVGTRYV